MGDAYTCRTCDDGIANIVELAEHGCEEILAAPTLSSTGQETLMYVEARLVDHRGVLDGEQMNHEDQQNLKLFQASGLLRVEWSVTPDEYRVEEFTDAAWRLARECRQMRAARMIDRDMNLGDVPGDGDD